MKKEIYLITTKGCGACDIQAHLINKLIKDTDIVVFEYPNDKIPQWISNNIIMYDFPTTIFVADDVIKYNFTGTRTVNEMKEIAKDAFNMYVPKEIAETKQFRKDIDDIIQRVKGLESSRETSITRTKLEEAVMWLGRHLHFLGDKNPYPESKNPESARIEPTADGLKL